MYKISVPVSVKNNARNDLEKVYEGVKALDAQRVFLSIGRYETDKSKREETIKNLREQCLFFKSKGLEVGAWIWTFLINGEHKFTNIRNIDGVEVKESACPSDDDFVEFACGYISDIAKCGVDMIMFDDDFRFAFLNDDEPACLCNNHIKRINQITGEVKNREELFEYITSGKKNKFRDAYIKVNKGCFENFAEKVRDAVDSVDKNIRVGFCSCMSAWDIDGTNAAYLAKILAGDTKPFVRLIGAPYWAVNKAWGNCLQDVVELERMESVWTRQGEIEIFAEGDAWPRPRINCPASYLEGFDTAIRASGCTDGILKYGLDYVSSPDYEMGYINLHKKHRELYESIDKHFSDKKSCGVRVYESMNKLSDMVCPTVAKESVKIQDMFFSKASRFLSHNAIPTVYEGKGICGIVFDENARNLPLDALNGGLILDIYAAQILSERGIDVGIKSFDGGFTSFEEEHFLDTDNYILLACAQSCNITLNEKAEVLSEGITENGKIPLSYRYEDSSGNKFFVLNIKTDKETDILNHYEKGRQCKENIEWLSSIRLPAYCYGHPHLYIQCKENENALSVGVWNFSADVAFSPKIELSEEYDSVEFINCLGELKGDSIVLSDIPAFSFAGFEVKK